MREAMGVVMICSWNHFANVLAALPGTGFFCKATASFFHCNVFSDEDVYDAKGRRRRSLHLSSLLASTSACQFTLASSFVLRRLQGGGVYILYGLTILSCGIHGDPYCLEADSLLQLFTRTCARFSS
jgi:hypothetical protein